MDQRVLDLSRLTKFVLKTLSSTEEVKNILQTQCEEANFVLAPWQIETIRRRELDKNSCTCVGVVSSEDHVKEIASGIDRAVAQARNLREKLATNVLEEKKLARRPSVQEIYAPGLREAGSRTKLGESKAGKENSIFDKADGRNSRAALKLNEACATGQRKQKTTAINEDNSKVLNGRVNRSRSCSKGKTAIARRKIADNKLVDTSPYNSLVAASKAEVKSKGKKNFIAANKSSLKSMKTLKPAAVNSSRKSEPGKILIPTSGSSAASKSSDSIISRAASAAEFKNLISKISLESENGMIKSAANSDGGKGCPVHDINAPNFVEEKIFTSVDVAEGLDRFGVPSELVKVLKVYHSYLNSQSIGKPVDKRGERSECKFLEEFEAMNSRRRKASKMEKLDNLCRDFLPVFKESFDRRIDFIELSRLKIRYTDLDISWKKLQIRTLSPTKRKVSNMVENRCQKNSLELNRTWRLNSVWNEACIPSLEGMSHTRCIRYSNRNQLLELFQFMQRTQQLKYQTSLVDFLINEVVPLARNSLEPTGEEYAAVYKTISIISNLLNPRVPVLVRTDV